MRKAMVYLVVFSAVGVGAWMAIAAEGNIHIFTDIPSLTPPEGAVTESEAFENVELLNHLSVQELFTTMAYFRRSLGVGCSHCHDVSAFPSDAKQNKTFAREQIEMTRYLNENVFQSEAVLCYTCHRDETKPPKFPAASMGIRARVSEPE